MEYSGLEKLKSPEQIQKDLDFIEQQDINLKKAIDEVDNTPKQSVDNVLKKEETLAPESVEGRIDDRAIKYTNWDSVIKKIK